MYITIVINWNLQDRAAGCTANRKESGRYDRGKGAATVKEAAV